jgi:putative ABC transport system permease protein
VASGQGLKDDLRTIVAGLGSEVLVQHAGASLPELSHVGPADVAALRALPEVRDVSVVTIGASQLPDRSQVLVFGVDTGQALIRAARLVAGRFPRPGTDEVVVGRASARRLGLSPGDVVELAGRNRFRVVGVFETGQGVTNSSAVIDVAAAQRIFGLGDTINLAFLNLKHGAAVDDVIERILRDLPNLEARPSDVWVSSIQQLEVAERYTRYLGLVVLVIVALGVATSMSMNVTERTQEVGILRAIGWSRFRVLRLVLLEVSLIAIAGAAAGLCLARLAVLATSTLPVSWSFWLNPAAVRGRILAVGLVVSVAASLAGSLPAIGQVLRGCPADSLRHG